MDNDNRYPYALVFFFVTLFGVMGFRMSGAPAAQERDGTFSDNDQVELGVDIARFGTDESVLYVRQGGRIVGVDDWRGSDTQVSAGRIAATGRQYRAATVKVDASGVGGGVTDALRHPFRGSGVTVTGVNGGEALRAGFDQRPWGKSG